MARRASSRPAEEVGATAVGIGDVVGMVGRVKVLAVPAAAENKVRTNSQNFGIKDLGFKEQLTS
jgi:hypothetical protein